MGSGITCNTIKTSNIKKQDTSFGKKDTLFMTRASFYMRIFPFPDFAASQCKTW